MPDMVEKKRTGVNWSLVIKLVVTCGIIGYLIHTQDWGKILGIVRTADKTGIAISVAISGAVISMLSFRWWIILRIQKIHLPLPRLIGLNLIGQFFNSFLLGSTGGDVVRVYYLIRQVPDRKALATLSLVIDRVFGLAALLIVAAFALPSQLTVLDRDPHTRQIAFFLYLILAAGGLAGIAALYSPLHKLPPFFHRLWLRVPKRELVAEIFHGGRAYGRSIPLSLSALGLGCVIHLTNFAAAWFIMRALGLEVDFISAVIMMALIIAAMCLPISISGFGVREAMFILMFSLYGLIGDAPGMRGSEYAVAASLLYYARDLFWSLAGGLVYLGWSHQRKADPAVS